MTKGRSPHMPDERYVLYQRDEDGVVYAVEVVDADRWSDALAEPLNPHAADVRLVRLRRGRAPAEVPTWLRVQAGRRVAEAATAYDGAPRLAGDEWRVVPWRRAPGPSLAEYLEAAATALRHPEAPPTGEAARTAALAAFGERHDDFAPLRTLRADALERWFARTHGTPEVLADAIALARLDAHAPEVAARLRFLRAAHVAPEAHRELAFDRIVLLEQASPWRALEDGLSAPALAALDAWIAHYRRAYDRHYATVRAGVARTLRDHDRGVARLVALQRLNGLAALGPPDGVLALQRAEAVAEVLRAMPAMPVASASTAGVLLGQPHAAVEDLAVALQEASAALEQRSRRLAAALTARILNDARISDLDRVLGAIQASELSDLDRVLDAPFLAHLERVLAEQPVSPLARVAARFPVVAAEDLDEAVEAFRLALRDALDASSDDRVHLGDPGAPPE